MTYVIGTQVRASDPAAMRDNIGKLVRPKLTDAGAQYVAGFEARIGGEVGDFVVGSRWDSVDQGLSVLAAFYEDPEVQDALAASPVEVTGRILARVQGEGGSPQGAYALGVVATMATPDNDRLPAMMDDLTAHISAHGCNGARMMQSLIAGEGIGSWTTLLYTDSVDGALQAIAATYENSAMMEHFAALGIQILGRTLVESI